MVKTLKTRIRNRYDSLANWTKDNVELLQGELALVKVETQQIDEETGDLVTVPAFLIKVGENYTEDEAADEGNNTLKDTPKPFDKLPWMSALAADVYDWAKVEDPSVVTIKYMADNTWVSSTLADVLKTIKEVLPKKIEDVESNIASVNTAISGGVHFIGITTTELEDGSTKNSIIIDNKDNSVRNKGDVVIYGEKEFIWTGDSWYELGDLTRVGAVEESLSLLPENDRTTNKYVTHIANENGKLVAKKARPLATEVQYDSGNTSNTVYSKIEDAFAAIATKADGGHDHPSYVNQNAFSTIAVSGQTPVNADTATDTVTFVGSNVSITTDATKDEVTFTVEDGSTSAKGIVQLSNAVDSPSETLAATSKAVKSAYEKAEAAAADAASRAPDIHTHGNITNAGTITVSALTDTSGIGGVVVTDSNNKITRMTPATVRSLIGAGTSSLELGTTETTAAAGNHTHADYEADITAIEANYIRTNTDEKLVHYVSGIETEIILDCGGAEI